IDGSADLRQRIDLMREAPDGTVWPWINRYGYTATAAYGAVNQLMSWVQLPAMSLGITATILAAHAVGAGRTARLPAIARTGVLLGLATLGMVVVLV
ncbi:MATE family efflux transporter, partial [Mesorhizobium sp. M4B.F.Ca.ET.203.01.1.1]|uniref:MATE family efflux transporter n=1 Tax=Mesorhizobium sp. M4B.F.Ca.ET.203.01.1.1 TaxID=2563953 RepID=UPI001FDFE310